MNTKNTPAPAKIPYIYVASSWRNEFQQEIVKMLRNAGIRVYDFKNPPARSGFGWDQIDKNWKQWNFADYVNALNSPQAKHGFNSDADALDQCDVCIIVLPCGRSAHLEAGYAIGKGKPTLFITRDGEEPELMVKLADRVNFGEAYLMNLPVASSDSLRRWVESVMRHTNAPAAVASHLHLSTTPSTTETVNHPLHYGGDTTYEAIKVIQAWGLGWELGDAVKYIARVGLKDASKVVEDLKKAAWYIKAAIERFEREGNYLGAIRRSKR